MSENRREPGRVEGALPDERGDSRKDHGECSGTASDEREDQYPLGGVGDCVKALLGFEYSATVRSTAGERSEQGTEDTEHECGDSETDHQASVSVDQAHIGTQGRDA